MSSIRNSVIKGTTWLAILLTLLGLSVQGQNLVPNPSFEDVNTCLEFNQPCSPSAWFYLSRKLTTGYFPRYPSATGSRHLQIVAASRQTVNRQYWETMLLCPLEAGKSYTVTLKVASPRNSTELNTVCPNLRDLGLWFTTRFIFVQGDSILQPRSYFSLSGATTKDLKNGWFEIKKEFVPTANATILIVGNFYRLANADILDQRNWTGQTIDVLVDDISVVPAKGIICGNAQKIKDSLYSITRRHSDHIPGDPTATTPGTQNAPDTSGKGVPPADSLQRPGNPAKDPTPQSSQPDTIILHNIQFDFDKYLVQNPDTLQRYRTLLTRPGIKKIQVVGFTDETGSETYNLDLSQKRAQEVARLLTSKFNVPPGLITAEGRGISRVYPTKDLNRRVEIYIYHE
jgi:outer membrane protein OmpA-like peptidoglycan-associated protein